MISDVEIDGYKAKIKEKYQENLEELTKNQSIKEKKLQDKRTLEIEIYNNVVDVERKKYHDLVVSKTVELHEQYQSALKQHENNIAAIRENADKDKNLKKEELLKKIEEEKQTSLAQAKADFEARQLEIDIEFGFYKVLKPEDPLAPPKKGKKKRKIAHDCN